MTLAVYDGMCVLRIVSRQPEDPTQASRSYFRARANRALAAARQAATEEERVRLLRTASLYELNAELERRMKSRKVAFPKLQRGQTPAQTVDITIMAPRPLGSLISSFEKNQPDESVQATLIDPARRHQRPTRTKA